MRVKSIAGVALCFASSVLSVSAYHLLIVRPAFLSRPVVATVSVADLVKDKITELARSGADATEVERQTVEFQDRMQAAIDHLEARDHVTLFVREALVGEKGRAIDYTDVVRRAINANETAGQK